MTGGKRMGETIIIHGNPNHSGYATFLYTGSRYLNCGNKTANTNVKKLVYLQPITAKWHIETSKNNERWYYFRSTFTLAKCC